MCASALALLCLHAAAARMGTAGRRSPPGKARPGPVWAGATHVCVLLPSRCLAYVKQLLDWGGRDAAPRRARPGMGRSTTSVCATP